ncbi:MAG: glycerol-3-phosphate acyltransferase [Bacteroidia bacterium]
MLYLLGSVPSAVWVGKMFFGIDVREYGSGNAERCNQHFRGIRPKAGVPVLIMDITQGLAYD